MALFLVSKLYLWPYKLRCSVTSMQLHCFEPQTSDNTDITWPVRC